MKTGRMSFSLEFHVFRPSYILSHIVYLPRYPQCLELYILSHIVYLPRYPLCLELQVSRVEIILKIRPATMSLAVTCHTDWVKWQSDLLNKLFQRWQGPAEGIQKPMPRQGHVAWLWETYMFVFGGAYGMRIPALADPANLGINDLWAFDLVCHKWHEVHASGMCPSARCDMGQSFFHRLL
jgi:hypothetical protein